MRIALLQLDPIVGALDANVDSVLSAARRAAEKGATLAVTGELAITGYPPRDLLDRPAFVRAIERVNKRLVAEAPHGLTLVVGTVRERPAGAGRPLENVALVIENGRVIASAVKQLLPTYDVFDEDRYFEPGEGTVVVQTAAGKLALSICEDAWNDEPTPLAGDPVFPRYPKNPLAEVGEGAVDLLINLSASPFTLAKRVARTKRFANIARRRRSIVVFVNQVGANDELLFDGRSAVFDREGEIIARANAFEPDELIVDLEAPKSNVIAKDLESDEEAAYLALVAGIRGYTRKCGFSKVVLGLSGGIDSALVATLAADALGRSAVLGVALPSRYSSQGSLDDAAELAIRLGIELTEIPIEPMFASYATALLPVLERVPAPTSGDVTMENIQARIRGAVLMAISNRTGALLLTTGNKSELAVGYSTLYGDMCGGLAVISDLPKTLVWRLSRWINRDGVRIPVSSIEKAPSAELRPDQKDEDSLPAYPLLDRILERHIEDGYDRAALLAEGLDEAAVDLTLRLVRLSEYKRRQAAPGLILTKKAFGVGRRMPVAQAFRE